MTKHPIHGLRALLAAAALGLAAQAAAGADDQSGFQQLVAASGASNGAARICGASAADVGQHEATARANLQRYAREYGYRTDDFDAHFRQGQSRGAEMMLGMRNNGVDGCAGVLDAFQRERAISYEDMKRGIAEVTDGLPGEKPAE
ncbi:hypothetical protein [Bordetella sp. 2513F-2]